ncbi:hypothetical protein D3273_02385 [Lichenibacterium minor]|uniref:Uncharacterized protein n=1 Tax=Lichenibacterium minor TaxID=2316528 RepID=A0A4Q2UA07_9HYPH|nr:hypothetical protein [Lichenibacterium minor]RYC33342.1 hypothetical protein D3273_02385 [Lichenibacterium minor]
MITVVEDRVLARIALESVAWNEGGDPARLADVALGQAVIALRVLGIPTTPEVTRAVGDDIAAVIADPELLARARSSAARLAA